MVFATNNQFAIFLLNWAKNPFPPFSLHSRQPLNLSIVFYGLFLVLSYFFILIQVYDFLTARWFFALDILVLALYNLPNIF